MHLQNIAGAVFVKNTNGAIALENVTGPVSVDSANGTIAFDSTFVPSNDIALTSINGNIELSLPTATPAFRWSGQTLRGDFYSTMPVAGKFSGPNFRTSAASQIGPQIITNALMGNVYLLRRGTRPAEAQSLRKQLQSASAEPRPNPNVARSLNTSMINGDLIYATSLGNISVGQVRGAAHVETRAGEVRLGIVQSQCDVISLGGPLTLGDIMGPLTARTSAGDVHVNATHNGAVITTGGGIIQMLFAAGATNLRSSGGDIMVRQASGPITADTTSGDITIGIDPSLRSAAVEAKTEQGNILLSVSPQLAADIEATLLTSDPDANAIHTDFTGLTIKREQVGTKTRIRATGKVNGGGERVNLYAEEGDITIRATVYGPMLSGPSGNQ